MASAWKVFLPITLLVLFLVGIGWGIYIWRDQKDIKDENYIIKLQKQGYIVTEKLSDGSLIMKRNLEGVVTTKTISAYQARNFTGTITSSASNPSTPTNSTMATTGASPSTGGACNKTPAASAPVAGSTASPVTANSKSPQPTPTTTTRSLPTPPTPTTVSQPSARPIPDKQFVSGTNGKSSSPPHSVKYKYKYNNYHYYGHQPIRSGSNYHAKFDNQSPNSNNHYDYDYDYDGKEKYSKFQKKHGLFERLKNYIGSLFSKRGGRGEDGNKGGGGGVKFRKRYKSNNYNGKSQRSKVKVTIKNSVKSKNESSNRTNSSFTIQQNRNNNPIGSKVVTTTKGNQTKSKIIIQKSPNATTTTLATSSKVKSDSRDTLPFTVVASQKKKYTIPPMRSSSKYHQRKSSMGTIQEDTQPQLGTKRQSIKVKLEENTSASNARAKGERSRIDSGNLTSNHYYKVKIYQRGGKTLHGTFRINHHHDDKGSNNYNGEATSKVTTPNYQVRHDVKIVHVKQNDHYSKNYNHINQKKFERNKTVSNSWRRRRQNHVGPASSAQKEVGSLSTGNGISSGTGTSTGASASASAGRVTKRYRIVRGNRVKIHYKEKSKVKVHQHSFHDLYGNRHKIYTQTYRINKKKSNNSQYIVKVKRHIIHKNQEYQALIPQTTKMESKKISIKSEYKLHVPPHVYQQNLHFFHGFKNILPISDRIFRKRRYNCWRNVPQDVAFDPKYYGQHRNILIEVPKDQKGHKQRITDHTRVIFCVSTKK